MHSCVHLTHMPSHKGIAGHFYHSDYLNYYKSCAKLCAYHLPASSHSTIRPLFKILLYYLYICVCHGQKRLSDLLELEFQEVKNSLLWVLGTELGSSEEQ